MMNVCIQVSDDGGKTLAALIGAMEARRQPRDLDRSERPELLPRRLRRRHLRELRSRRQLATFKPNLPVTQFYESRATRAVAVLPRLRRHAGQLHARRPGPHTSAARHHERRLVRRAGRRRLPLPGRSEGPEHRLRRIAVRRAGAASTGAPGQRVQIQPQAGARRAAAALELGLARCSSARTTRRGSTSPPIALPQRRSRRLVEGDQPPT